MTAEPRFSLLFGYLGDDGPRDELFGWVLRWWKANFPTAQICMGRNFDQQFHRGKARNDAARAATEDILIIADADTVPTAEAVREGVRMVAANEAPWVLPYRELGYYNLSESATARWLQTRPETTHIPAPSDDDDYEHELTAWAGVLILPHVAFKAVGGYDERFVGWGGEDNAFQLAMDVLVGRHRRIEDAHISHLWHPRGDADFTQPQWPHNAALLRRYRGATSQLEMRAVLHGS